jgi:predicted dehydrogenase/nucleoside-diphosphate-sugar epimerase
MKRTRVGLVGAGYISEFHIAALRRLSGVELLGLFDLDARRARATGEKFHVPVFPSLAALREAGAESLHVLTPPHTHAHVALNALDLGCHVLVEKPLAVDVNDCERIDAVAAEKGLRVCVNHSLLFDPQVRRALAAVRAGRLGKVVSVDILRSSVYPPYAGGPLPPRYRTPGYPFRDLGVHALYLFQAFLGPIENVTADWASLGGDPNLAFDEWRAQVRCRDGLGQFQLSWNVKPLQSQIIVQGTRGVLRVDLFLMFQALRAVTPLPKTIERVLNAVTDSTQPMIDVPRGIAGFLMKRILPYHGLHDLVAAFYQSLAEGTPPPVTVKDATPVVRWTEEIARMADRDQEARLARLTVSEVAPVLVTGASGSLGSALVQRLRAEGKRVRVMQRRVPERAPEGTEVVVGDLGDPEGVERAVQGARFVFHVGAAMKGGGIEHQCGTVTGTRNVLEACVRHGVEKLVHISSLSVVDWAGAPAGAVLNEESSLEPRAEERGDYTRAKLEAERLVSEYTREHGLRSVILRPGQIFGGRTPLLTPAVARWAGGRWLVLGDGRLRLPLVYIDDVVDGILLAAESPLGGGEVIQLVDEEPWTQNDVLHAAVGEPLRVVRVPRPLVFALGKVSELLLRPLGRPSPLSAYRLRSALAQRRFESRRAHDLLSWSPRVGVREGIRRCVLEETTAPIAFRARVKLDPAADLGTSPVEKEPALTEAG